MKKNQRKIKETMARRRKMTMRESRIERDSHNITILRKIIAMVFTSKAL